jgi:hypothetical protein
MGYFELKGSRFDDYWIELGGELSEQFGMSFACLSVIGLFTVHRHNFKHGISFSFGDR